MVCPVECTYDNGLSVWVTFPAVLRKEGQQRKKLRTVSEYVVWRVYGLRSTAYSSLHGNSYVAVWVLPVDLPYGTGTEYGTTSGTYVVVYLLGGGGVQPVQRTDTSCALLRYGTSTTGSTVVATAYILQYVHTRPVRNIMESNAG